MLENWLFRNYKKGDFISIDLPMKLALPEHTRYSWPRRKMNHRSTTTNDSADKALTNFK